MSTPKRCPGCGNRCSLSAPSCSTGEAYRRALRAARKKAAEGAPQPGPESAQPRQPAAGPAPSEVAAPSPSPAPVSPAPPAPGAGGKTRARASAPRRSRPKPRNPSAPPEQSRQVYEAFSLEERLALQLHRLSRRMAQNQPREKSGQGRVLALLEQRGPMKQRELLELTGVRSSSLSELLGKLEGAGLIRRDPCPTDRRTGLVSLTPEGSRRAAQRREDTRRDTFRALSPAEREELLALLEKLDAPAEGGCPDTPDAP